MMTEAELWHMQLLAGENVWGGWEFLATIMFAYLATAYFVGAKLSRFQAALATVFFTIIAGSSCFFTWIEYRRAVFFMRRLTENYGIQAWAPNDALVPVMAILFALLIPACVYFMYQVRKTARPGEASD